MCSIACDHGSSMNSSLDHLHMDPKNWNHSPGIHSQVERRLCIACLEAVKSGPERCLSQLQRLAVHKSCLVMAFVLRTWNPGSKALYWTLVAMILMVHVPKLLVPVRGQDGKVVAWPLARQVIVLLVDAQLRTFR